MNKEQQYQSMLKEAAAVLENEDNYVSIMATISAILKLNFPSFYWVGFYFEENGILKIGPYQGTIGCLTIETSRGVCGRAFVKGTTQIVDDVHQDPNHIACDPRSNSEIVVPVYNKENKIFAVLDIDSEEFKNFDDIDKQYLEKLITNSFSSKN